MKKLVSLLLAMAMAASLAACGQKEEPAQEEAPEGEAVELTVFAAASMTETLDEIITLYQSVAPQVTIVPSYASSGDLLKQIQEGAVRPLYLRRSQADGHSGGGRRRAGWHPPGPAGKQGDAGRP